MLATTFIVIVILLAISALFAGSETALTAVSRGRMHQLEKEGSRSAACVNRLVENRERLIGSLLLGNTFINILASSLMTSALEDQLGKRAVAITTTTSATSTTVSTTSADTGRPMPNRSP